MKPEHIDQLYELAMHNVVINRFLKEYHRGSMDFEEMTGMLIIALIEENESLKAELMKSYQQRSVPIIVSQE